MKGFMFSIEGIASLVIVLLALSMIALNAPVKQSETNMLELKMQSSKQMTMYFNLNEKSNDVNAITQYCTKVTKYDTFTKKVIDKNVCEGMK
jgi:hypothetical protein